MCILYTSLPCKNVIALSRYLCASSVEDIWDFIWKIMLQIVPMVLGGIHRETYTTNCFEDTGELVDKSCATIFSLFIPAVLTKHIQVWNSRKTQL